MADAPLNFLLHIRGATAENIYPLEVRTSTERFAEGQMHLALSDLLSLQNDAPAYGLKLFSALFTGEVRSIFDKSLGQVESQPEGRLRVQLAIEEEAAELHRVFWERLHTASGKPLTTTAQTPFSRYSYLNTPAPTPIAERPLRLLAVVANPSDLGTRFKLTPVDVEKEITVLLKGLQAADQKMDVRLLVGRTGLPAALTELVQQAGWKVVAGNATLDTIVSELRDTHIFHFIGHGVYSKTGGTALVLEDDNGLAALQRDDDIAARLGAIGNAMPRLIFMVACESARQTEADGKHPFVGLAPKLVQAGIPAVLAMQDLTPVEMARRLTGEFYERLAEHGEVDRAMNEARLLVYSPKNADWGIPVLFSRLKNGQLFANAESVAATPKPTVVNTNTTINQGGNANINNTGTISVGGDFVGRDKITTTTNTVTTGWQATAVQERFTEVLIKAKSTTTDAEQKEKLKTRIKGIEAETLKGAGANLARLGRLLTGLSDELFNLVFAILTDSSLNLAPEVQKVALDVQSER